MPPFRQARLAGPSTRAGTMSTFTFGHVQVRRSGYGAMQLADPYAFGPPPDRASAIGVLRAAVAAGVDHIDTAQYHGVVNDLIREALYPYAVTCLPGELSQPRRDRVPSRSADAPSPGVLGQVVLATPGRGDDLADPVNMRAAVIHVKRSCRDRLYK
jgi:pyridoxine 4-dehydrogenase